MSIVPFPMWILPQGVVYRFSFLLLFVLSLKLFNEGKISINKYNLLIFFSLVFFYLYLILPITENTFDKGSLLRFASFFPLVFFSKKIHYEIFKYFRTIIIISSIFGILIFFLLLIGVDLPYYKIDGFSIPMQRNNDYYRLYGLVVSSTNTVYNFMGVNIARVCGPFQEPGHFAIFIGIVLSIEKFLWNKTSLLLVIAGFLTFSPAFIAIFALIISYDILLGKRFKLLLGLIFSFAILFGVIIQNQKVKDALYYISIGRNFSNIEEASLDSRTGEKALRAYNSFSKTKAIWTGKGEEWVNERYGVLSDYRGFVFRFGLLGLFLSVLLSVVILTRAKKQVLFFFFPILVLIHAHRFWMFLGPYIYILFLIGISSYFYINEKVNREIDKVKS